MNNYNFQPNFDNSVPNAVYNPYSQYNNQIGNMTSPITPNFNNNINNNNQFNNQQQTVIPNTNEHNYVIANTYLPKNYYEDIQDNLELISLNMINDLKTLIKNQKKMKVAKFDTTLIHNMQNSIKDQFYEVEKHREKYKNKLINEFNQTKEEIEILLNQRFKHQSNILHDLANEFKQEKEDTLFKLSELENEIEDQDEDVKKLLLNSDNHSTKYGAEKVYKPNEKSELELAIEWAKGNATGKDLEDINNFLEDYPLRTPEEIFKENNPEEYERLITENILRNEEARRLKKEQAERDRIMYEEDQMKLDESRLSTEVQIPEETKPKNIEKPPPKSFKVCAIAVVALQKLLIIKRLKLYSRLKLFSDSLLHIEEYLEDLMENILEQPFKYISDYNVKFNLKNNEDIENFENLLMRITDTLYVKTTKVKINRTFTLFFTRNIFLLDVVPPQFFSLFERLRIEYVPKKEMNFAQKKFVLIMKIIINTLVYENLLRHAENAENENIKYNFKLIATAIYYSLILYYQQEFPKFDKEFNNAENEYLLIDMNEDVFEKNNNVDNHFLEAVNKLNEMKESEIKTIKKYKKENIKNLVMYKPDSLPDEIEELSKLLLPIKEVENYLRTKTDYDIIDSFEKWITNVLEIMNSHNEVYIND